MTQTEKITKLLDNSILFTDEQKQGWVELLPKMKESELSELYGILADEVKELKNEGINLIEDPKLEAELIGADHGASLDALKKMASSDEFAKELKREVTTPELRKPTPEELGKKPAAPILRPAPAPVATKVVPKPFEMASGPVRHTDITAGLKSLSDIKAVDDLKKVQTEHLRQGELKSQIEMIKAKILNLAHANKLLPFYTVAAFEESPLYKTYLTIGAAMITDANPNRAEAYDKAAKTAGRETLTIREFEAVADLRKQIEQF